MVQIYPQASNSTWLNINFADRIIYSVRVTEFSRLWPAERLLGILEDEGHLTVADPLVLCPYDFRSEEGGAFLALILDLTIGRTIQAHSHYEPAWGSA